MQRAQIIGFVWDDYIILNSKHKYQHEESKNDNIHLNATDITIRMKESLLALKCEYISPDGDKVNYKLMKYSPLYQNYLETIQLLHDLDLLSLTVNERKAFFINIYNSLIIHALVEGIISEGRDSLYQRLRMYALTSYMIGPNVYSLNDIEHGILRGNRCSPTPFSSPQFSSRDPRLQYSLELDPRIHFTLNCGAKSCPNVKVYLETKLERQLQAATSCFLSNIQTSLSERSVTVSMLFKWYRNDFGKSDGDILRWIERHAPEDVARAISILRNEQTTKSGLFSSNSSSIKLYYFPYDWNINS